MQHSPADGGTEDAASPRTERATPRSVQAAEIRWRRAVALASLIRRIVDGAVSAAGDAVPSAGDAVASAGLRRGAHRPDRHRGRHRAPRADAWLADAMGRRRTIGGRPVRDVGRTALSMLPMVMLCGIPLSAWLVTLAPAPWTSA